MSTTPVTLLGRLQTDPVPVDWERFHTLYAPLIQSWLRGIPGLNDESTDIVQEVLLIVVQEIARFERQRDGAFRAWLRAITVNKVRSYFKKRNRRPVTGVQCARTREDVLAQLEDASSTISQDWDREHDRHIFDRILFIVKPDFTAQTWDIFTRYALQGEPASQVAQSFGISEAAVFLTKSRVLKRLRAEAGGLID